MKRSENIQAVYAELQTLRDQVKALMLERENFIPRKFFCAFCDKNREEAKMLIAGAICCICDECIETCVRLVKKQKHKEVKS